MIKLTRAQAREADRLAIEELGIPSMVLMENAGHNVAEIALDYLRDALHLVAEDARVVVLCGGGNNGGDGYVVTRHLHNAGVHVTAMAAKAPQALEGDAAVQQAIVERLELVVPFFDDAQVVEHQPVLAEAHLIIDALLGTGFSGQVRGHLATVIELCNQARRAGAQVLAVDLPSGLDCDTGQPSNATVEADLTVTLVAEKAGFAAPQAGPYLGQVLVADIGAPPQLLVEVLNR